MPNPIKEITKNNIVREIKKKIPNFNKSVTVSLNDEFVDMDAPLVSSRPIKGTDEQGNEIDRVERTYILTKGYCRCNVCGHKYCEDMRGLHPSIADEECCTSDCECCSQWCA